MDKAREATSPIDLVNALIMIGDLEMWKSDENVAIRVTREIFRSKTYKSSPAHLKNLFQLPTRQNDGRSIVQSTTYQPMGLCYGRLRVYSGKIQTGALVFPC